jgi:hypothetical protein
LIESGVEALLLYEFPLLMAHSFQHSFFVLVQSIGVCFIPALLKGLSLVFLDVLDDR